MANKKSPSLKYKEVYQFPIATHTFIEKLCKGKTLHVCCGNSLIGDIRIDIEKQPNQDNKPGFILGDMFDLNKILKAHKIKTQSFDTIVCDPIWHLGYHVRHKLMFQLRDQLKPGGNLIFNCLWFPKIRTLELKKMYVGLNSSAWRNVSLIGIYKKINYQLL
jgi:hypothetical protein